MLVGLPITTFDWGGSERTESGDEVATYHAELPSGLPLTLHEGEHIFVVGPDTIAAKGEIVVLARHGGDVERVSDVEPRIEPSIGSADHERYDLYGSVLETDAKDLNGDRPYLYILDVGQGTVLVEPPSPSNPLEDSRSFAVGEELRVRDARLEFYDEVGVEF